MNPYKEEIIHAHAAIENWLSKGVGSTEALIARFAADFTMITPRCLSDYPALGAFSVRSARVARVWLSWLSTLTLWRSGRKAPRCVIVSDSNCRAKAETVRWSTVILKRERGRIVWRHLHETTVTA